jgi:hypothetical protein
MEEKTELQKQSEAETKSPGRALIESIYGSFERYMEHSVSEYEKLTEEEKEERRLCSEMIIRVHGSVENFIESINSDPRNKYPYMTSKDYNKMMEERN